MASIVWIDGLYIYPDQIGIIPSLWNMLLASHRNYGNKVIIAKGNIIEGIEAKE